jgi:cell division transport system permease protein
VLEAVTAAVLGAGLAAGTMVAVKSFVIDARLQPNITFIAWVTWDDVIAILPWLFGVGIGTAILASGITLRRYLKG